MTTKRRFLADELPSGSTRLNRQASHHLIHVLRLGPGDRVFVFNGRGEEVETEVVSTDGGVVTVIPAGDVISIMPVGEHHVVVGLLKAKAMDIGLRMMVEAGATHIHVVAMERSIVRPPKLDRWQRIVESAAQQCGRSDLPVVRHHQKLRDVVDELRASAVALYVASPGATPTDSQGDAAAVVIGPEGGLTDRELNFLQQNEARPISLGRWVLRADTACAVATAWLANR